MSTRLPEFLYGTYIRLKDDTDTFVNWLVEAGLRCGYQSLKRTSVSARTLQQTESPTVKKEKLKGRARMLEKRRAAANKRQNDQQDLSSEMYHVACEHLIPLARAISASPGKAPRVPPWMLVIGRRLIAARTRCNNWFIEHSHGDEDDSSNVSHWQFIRQLQTVMDLLEPLVSLGTVQELTNTDARMAAAQNSRDEHTIFNQFHCLTLQTEERRAVKKSVSDLAQDLPVSRNGSESVSRYTIESNSRQELLTACHCLLTDLNTIILHVEDTWTKYKNNEIMLLVAAAVTNTALDTGRRLIQDFEHDFAAGADYKTTFLEDFIPLTGNITESMWNKDPDKQKKGCEAPFDPVVAHMEHWGMMFEHTLLDRHRHLLTKDVKSEMDDHMSEIRAEAAVSPRSTGINFMGNRVQDPVSEFTASKDSKASSSSSLSEHLVSKLLDAVPYMSSSSLVKDRLIDSLSQLANEDHEIGLAEVFAARLFLRIYASTGLEGRRLASNEYRWVIHQYHARAMEFQTWLGRADAYRNISGSSARNYLMEQLDQTIRGWQTFVMPLLVKQIAQLHILNPVLCGHGIMVIRLEFNRLGQMLADAAIPPRMFAHIYNAARQEKFLSATWPDMDMLINLHTPEHLFVGGLPTERSKYYRIWELAEGVSLTQPHRQIHKGRQRLLTSRRNVLCELICARTFESGEAANPWGDELVLAILLSQQTKSWRKKIKMRPDGHFENGPDLVKQNKSKEGLRYMDLLEGLELEMMNEVDDLHFDYFAFMWSCCELHKECEAALAEEWSHIGAPLVANSSVDSCLKWISFPYDRNIPRPHGDNCRCGVELAEAPLRAVGQTISNWVDGNGDIAVSEIELRGSGSLVQNTMEPETD